MDMYIYIYIYVFFVWGGAARGIVNFWRNRSSYLCR